ncbi:MAG: BREX-4 system phosphatase PglZ [Firmicutes bacterium]|nr:BREX-4 system phosphatase PglZ [Bacillota bacterium]
MIKLDIKSAIERVKKDLKGKVLFVNAESQEDLLELQTALSTLDVVRLSSFFSNKNDMPDLPAIEERLKNVSRNTVALGLFSFFAFRKGAYGIIEQLNKYGRNQSGIVFVSYGLEKVFEKFNDPRISPNIICVDSGNTASLPVITMVATKTKGVLGSLKSFFEQLEDKGIHEAAVYSPKNKPQAFEKFWLVKNEKSGFEKLKTGLQFIEERWGDQEQWDWLHEQKGKLLKLTEIKSKIKNWSELEENDKWLCFISAKAVADCYIKRAADAASSTKEFVNNIYNYLLELEKGDSKFKEFYAERKDYICRIKSDEHTLAYFRLVRAKDGERVHYLTDLSQVEREGIIEWISESKPAIRELANILKVGYPILHEYLADYVFGNQILDEYFNGAGYKYYKLLNSIDDVFIARVDRVAEEKSYGLFDTIHSVVNSLPSKNVGKLWLDALGIEYAAFIKCRAKAHGLKVKISPVRVGLPTTTYYNKDFLVASGFSTKDDKLDDIKHAKAVNERFEKVATPIYLTRELEVIDELVKWIATQIKSGTVSSYALVSDHGASRLALVYKNSTKAIAIEKNGDADMRFAPLGVVDQSKHSQLTADENGFHCVTNYDFIKGGKTRGVEVHGGATLEEIIVPVAVFELEQKIDITFSPKKKTLKLKQGTLEKFTLALSLENQEVFIRVNEKVVTPILVKGSSYEFNLPIEKVGDYEAIIFVDNQEVGVSYIKIESSLAKEADMGI